MNSVLNNNSSFVFEKINLLAPYLLPEFISSLTKLDHFDREAFLRVHESGVQLVSIHLNTEKNILQKGYWPKNTDEPALEISGNVPWADDAYYLSNRPSFTLDPLFHAGAYYVQEASGMFVAFAIKKIADLSQKLKVLDLCAAPGGKSTLIQSLISPESILVSNEVIKSRVPVLTQNMTKWGRANTIVSNNDPVHFKQVPGFFDIMLIDAPCSGSGLYRKDPEAALTWSQDLVKLCSQRQQRILADVWDCLKEDGYLIYSTCSYSNEENEDILDHLFRQYPCESVALNPDPAWNIVATISNGSGAFGYRFYPDKTSGEGFFLAVIQKKRMVDSEHPDRHAGRYPNKRVHSNKLNEFSQHIPRSTELQINKWIKDGLLEYIPVGDSIHALTPGLANDFGLLKKSLYLKKAGIRVGKPGGQEWIPDHELALANYLKKDYPTIEISYPDALQYLRGEPFDTDVPLKGWHTVGYQGLGLGWVKLLERRMNNYYPKSWRIRQ